MHTIQDIQKALHDRNLTKVAKATGISRQTLSAIRSGTHTTMRLDTWQTLVKHLQETGLQKSEAL